MGPEAATTADTESAPAVHGKVFERLNEVNVFDPFGNGGDDTAASDSTGSSDTQTPTGGSGTTEPSKG